MKTRDYVYCVKLSITSEKPSLEQARQYCFRSLLDRVNTVIHDSCLSNYTVTDLETVYIRDRTLDNPF